MFRPKIHLDTSVINFLFHDDAPEKQEATIDFFDNYIKTGVYETFIPNQDRITKNIRITEDTEI